MYAGNNSFLQTLKKIKKIKMKEIEVKRVADTHIMTAGPSSILFTNFEKKKIEV